MKKYVQILCIMIMGQSLLSAQNVYEVNFVEKDFFYKLSLPYQCNERLSKIFTDDTTLAINIKEMLVDGELIFPQSDGILREFIPKIKTRRTRRNESIFYITMTWLPTNTNDMRHIVWNNLRSSYSYMIPEGSKTLLILYNVILPFPFANVEKLINNQIPEGFFTEDYLVKVNLDNVFK
ncbi:hypothetical protein [Breznakiella homolactica]|uniref:Uncharacterized protein n=1 Tax=Breznakiella homolactica TaxID=2798577 RepID=A0A7T7XQM5_9SPIR|nr:hypothetical protein [Breznakiella homolactica]QQO10707.1 hypothetical protein JFL75_07280 [Breznakiella homolactica]